MTPEEIQDEILVLEHSIGYINSLLEMPLGDGVFVEVLLSQREKRNIRINELKQRL